MTMPTGPGRARQTEIYRGGALGRRPAVPADFATLLGWRPQDLTIGSLPFSQGIGIAQYTSDPHFTDVVQVRIRQPAAGGAQGDPASRRRAAGVRLRVDAIVVSNHGGRQVDNAIASLDALLRSASTSAPSRPCSWTAASTPPYMYGRAAQGRGGALQRGRRARPDRGARRGRRPGCDHP